MPNKPQTISQLTRKPVVDNRPNAYQRGYTARWQRESKLFLTKNPLCVVCKLQGMTEPAKEVDHIIPHRGDYKLRWDANNWQSLCKMHHSQKTGRGQ